MIFGHRGAPGYPRYGENTKTSFRKALECGDGGLAVIHDYTVDRTTNGRGDVRNFSYDELRQFDAGFGECVPLLSDVLDEFGARCLLNIELKDSGIADDVKRLVLERRLE